MKNYPNFTQTATYPALQKRIAAIPSLQNLFEQDPHRTSRFIVEDENFILDYSKTHITGELLDLATALHDELSLQEQIDHLFEGLHVNTTEDRPALHTALRLPEGHSLMIDGQDIMPGIYQVREQMKHLAACFHQEKLTGITGKPLRYIVNIGIGGSYLGPLTVVNALRHLQQKPVAFLSNVDNEHLQDIWNRFPADETLFLVVSKSFSTPETLMNASAVKEMLVKKWGPQAVQKHFWAVSSRPGKAMDFGVKEENIFPMWDFVGGRYSVWSAVGLAIALSLGYEHFDAFLQGAHRADKLFRQEENLQKNPARLLGFISVIYRHFYEYASESYIPYRQRMAYLPFYLQQLIMESNGKSVQRNAEPVTYPTSPVIWGETGTNAQHSFFQALHQGTLANLTFFTGYAHPTAAFEDNNRFLQANLLAQAESLAFGRKNDDPFRHFPGNRPSITWLFDRMTPENLGFMLASFEHKTFVESVYWNINAFDQFGVELGKVNARHFDRSLQENQADSPLMRFILKHLRE